MFNINIYNKFLCFISWLFCMFYFILLVFCFIFFYYFILFCLYVLFWLAFPHFDFALSHLFLADFAIVFAEKIRKDMIDFPIGTVLCSMRAQKSCQNDSFTAFRDIFCEKPCLRLRSRLSWLRIALGYSTVSAYIHFLLFFFKIIEILQSKKFS